MDSPELHRASAGLTAFTGISLLIVVYYAGGAVTTPDQSLWMAIVSLLVVGGIAQGLAQFMTGRAVFLHVGGTLGTILLNETNQRPQRVVHNAVIAPAVLLFMISNHFPLIYGTSRPRLAAPVLVLMGCAVGLSLRWLSMRSRPI